MLVTTKAAYWTIIQRCLHEGDNVIEFSPAERFLSVLVKQSHKKYSFCIFLFFFFFTRVPPESSQQARPVKLCLRLQQFLDEFLLVEIPHGIYLFKEAWDFQEVSVIPQILFKMLLSGSSEALQLRGRAPILLNDSSTVVI